MDLFAANPIPLENIPAYNQFLIIAQLQTFKKASILPDPDQFLNVDRYWHLVEERAEPRETPIQTAARADYFNPFRETSVEQETLKHMCATLYARYHRLEDNDIHRLLMPDRFSPITPHRELRVKKVTPFETNFQNYIQTFYILGLRATINMMGGLQVWRRSRISQRMAVYEEIWCWDPLAMAIAALGNVAYAVFLEDIFSSDTVVHKKWQIFHKAVFLWTCEDVWSFRIGPGDPDALRFECYKAWKGVVRDKCFKVLDLGEPGEIPVRWGSVYNTGRRRAVRVVERGQDYKIPEP